MSRPKGDAARARTNIDGVLQLFDSLPDLNEYKFTTLVALTGAPAEPRPGLSPAPARSSTRSPARARLRSQ